ncbi:hypothetical protein DQ04_03721020 [Trypanosoma grayi]|uniref:hypothetical protein n=1 Tax=Trypanosoma grayi TaxID=71804 RepID=UPI0004F3F188|nr:hypothetical protein DQ04_03721020 [Trypanosoma grayi]KEG10429.1 hypothetical protein DQ04_03721020 [Trypanosoma grayi]
MTGGVLDFSRSVCPAVAAASSTDRSEGDSLSAAKIRVVDLNGGALAGVTIATFALGLLLAGLFSHLRYYCVARRENGHNLWYPFLERSASVSACGVKLCH